MVPPGKLAEHVAAQVSERILKSEGVLRSDTAQVSVNIDIKAGYVIDLTGDSQARTVNTVPTHKVIDAG